MGAIRVSIAIGSGKLEVEGASVEEVLTKLKGLPVAIPEILDQINQVHLAIPKPTTPKDVKLAYEILRLKKKGWFEKSRDVRQVIKKLEGMGMPATKRQISSALVWLMKKGELNRKEEENKIVYFSPPNLVKF